MRSLFQFQFILFRVEIDHFAVGEDFGHFAEGRHFELIATVEVTAFAAPANISDGAVFEFFGLPLLALEFQNAVLFVETENAFATDAVECDYGSASDAVNVLYSIKSDSRNDGLSIAFSASKVRYIVRSILGAFWSKSWKCFAM